MKRGYESAREAAQRLGVTVRAVQKWAAEGRIEGACRVGRTWLIPINASKGAKSEKTRVGRAEGEVPPVLPLMHASFRPEEFAETAESFENEDLRRIALSEYYYYIGQPEKCSDVCELYIDNADISISLSAGMMYLFANMACGRFNLAQLGLEVVRNRCALAMSMEDSPKLRAYAVYLLHAMSVLLHLNDNEKAPPLYEVMDELPEGHRFIACYMPAHYAYIGGDLSRANGMCDVALALGCETYPIGAMYIYMLYTSSLMGMKNIEGAKKAFMRGWAIAEKSNILVVITEHYDMIHGMADICLRGKFQNKLAMLDELGRGYGVAWRQLQNIENNTSIAEYFTPEEVAVAGLYRRGWTVNEISDYIGITPRAVKHTISVIYEKLDISSRNELVQYFVR